LAFIKSVKTNFEKSLVMTDMRLILLYRLISFIKPNMDIINYFIGHWEVIYILVALRFLHSELPVWAGPQLGNKMQTINNIVPISRGKSRVI
jgi:hypothetical protein